MSSKVRTPRKSGVTKQFGKDWKRLARSGRYPMHELQNVMQLLIDSIAPLPAEFMDHPLKGKWLECRDCHVRGDWVLIYRISATPTGEEIVFVRTGTHAELFE